MHNLRPILLTLFLSFFFTTMAFSENRVAVVIGNSSYEHVVSLENPENDAQLISSTFRSVGFHTEIFLDLNEARFGDMVDRIAQTAADADVLAVYYAGHAIQIEGENYLIPTDANLTTKASVARQTISMASLMEAMSHADVSMLFLDACRDNPFTDAIAKNEKASGRSVRITRGVAVVRPVGDMMIAFATLPDSVAFDGDANNSPFAQSLARHVPTENTEVSVIMKRVTRDVLARTEGQQRPQQLSQMQREFYFRQSGDAERVTDELRAILSVYPDTASVGKEIALVADVQPTCDATFFNVTASGKITPIPSSFFTRTNLSSGHLRYEISPGTRYGLVVQEEDERGTNLLGYYCAPFKMEKSQKVALLKVLREQLINGSTEGVAEFDSGMFIYQFQSYEIRD